VHAPEITGDNRRQRDTGFTLTSVVFLRFNSPSRTTRQPQVFDLGLCRWRRGAAITEVPCTVVACRERRIVAGRSAHHLWRSLDFATWHRGDERMGQTPSRTAVWLLIRGSS